MLGIAPISVSRVINIKRTENWAEHRLRMLNESLGAIYEGQWDEAERSLMRHRENALADAACLNLLGIIHQGRRQWRRARRFYGKAMKANPDYAPAEQNMRRLYELHTFGNTNWPIALADKETMIQIDRLDLDERRCENNRRGRLFCDS